MALQHPPAPVPQPTTHSLLPQLATGLTDQDRRRIEDALDRIVSANTRLSYASAWHAFEKWTQARGVPLLPAPPELVAAYLLELAEERQVSVATIRLHKAALATVHRSTGHEGVKRFMDGIARSRGRAQKQAKPLTAEALAAVRATAGSRRPLGGTGKRHESQAKAEKRGRIDLALLSVACCAGPRAQSYSGTMWNSVKTGPPFCTYPSPRRTRRPRERSCTSAAPPRRLCMPSFPMTERQTQMHRSSDSRPGRSGGE